MRIFKNRNLDDIVILDNSIFSFANQLGNGILINSFYNQKDDNELSYILDYLENYIISCEDVRIVNESIFNFERICSESSM